MVESNKSDDKSENADGQGDAIAFAARLRNLAEKRGISRANLIERTGIKKQTFAGYWNGERVPSAHVLLQLSEELDCSPRWLLAGQGRAPTTSTVSDRQFGYRAPPAMRDGDLVEVAEIDPRFGLGAALMDEDAAPEMRSFSRAWLRQISTSPPEELYWARGRGNSMEPTIGDGEVVLIDRTQQSPRDADLVWAFAWGDVGAIKRLRPMPDGTVKILSDNPAVPGEIAHEGELHIFGRVVAVVRRI